MRSFNNLKLINEIRNNPFETIGQRDFSVLESYMLGYNSFLELDLDDNLELKVKDISSIEDFTANEVGVEHNQRTVFFDFYVGLVSETKKDMLLNYYDFIDKYEKTYPIDESEYEFKLNKFAHNYDLKKNLKIFFSRPHIVNSSNLSDFRAYLDGYFKAKSDFNIDLSPYEKELVNFIDYWKGKVNKSLEFDTWDRPFRFERMGTTNFTSLFSWEIERFEEILSEEISIPLDEIRKFE